ncbi:MAG: trigger factor [Humidesulfovibrio sp.]|jgi:trigger factor|uniref:trigger factor n=1 Tax=Humidesulfovibrio sp. TaxID=2910988 RepID=UPI002732DBC9|nr:trigger factor [Humidesulfovibrio sp.]MDP2848055.1 trigger factor [Humidesulfovibrio sp.]
MEYKVEELSPVKRKINIQVPVEEVNAALSAAVALYRHRYEIKGFRRGKAPSSVVEGKYRSQIYPEATTDLVNYQINEALGGLGIMPLSRIDVDAKELVRDQEFNYSVEFEIAPDFALPDYEGLAVDVEKAEVKEEEVKEVEKRILTNAATVKPIEVVRAATDGDIVVITFAAYKGDEVFQGIQAENFELTLGDKQALPEFEEMIKTLKTGEKGECEIAFPEDFINPAMAGHTLTMRATLHSIKERIMPELTDEVAKRAGGFESVEKMREAITKSYLQSREQLNKSMAQKKLLDQLLAQVDFPLPPSMVENRIDRLLADLEQKLDRQGKSLGALGKSMEELREGHRTQAEEAVRGEILLLAVAKKENMDVKPEEIDAALTQVARQHGQDLLSVKQYYEENNLIYPLKDRLLADKAIELVYARAAKTEVAAAAPVDDESAETTAKPKKPRAKKVETAKE